MNFHLNFGGLVAARRTTWGKKAHLTRDPTIIVRHDLYAERAVTKGEISAAPSGLSANTKEMDVYLAERPRAMSFGKPGHR